MGDFGLFDSNFSIVVRSGGTEQQQHPPKEPTLQVGQSTSRTDTNKMLLVRPMTTQQSIEQYIYQSYDIGHEPFLHAISTAWLSRLLSDTIRLLMLLLL